MNAFTDMPIPLLCFWAVFLLVLGACVGSFLNVVVYRLPAGLSVVHPSSHCPRCKHAIRPYDNIPVISWLVLRGRCRDCGASFSIRYAAIEALMGGLFVVLFVLEILWGEQTLPARAVSLSPALWLPHVSPLMDWGVYAFHLLLLCTLLCAGLIRYDGHPIPWLLFAPGWIVGSLAPLYWVALRPLPLAIGAAPDGWVVGAFEGLAGFATGAVLAGLSGAGLARRRPLGDRRGEMLQASLVGLFLGWQAISAIACVVALLHLIGQGIARLRPAATSFLTAASTSAAAVVYLVGWQTIVQRLPWLGREAGLPTVVAAAALVWIASLAGSVLTPAPKKKKRKR